MISVDECGDACLVFLDGFCKGRGECAGGTLLKVGGSREDDCVLGEGGELPSDGLFLLLVDLLLDLGLVLASLLGLLLALRARQRLARLGDVLHELDKTAEPVIKVLVVVREKEERPVSRVYLKGPSFGRLLAVERRVDGDGCPRGTIA